MSRIVSRLTVILLPLFALLLSHNARAQQDFIPPAIPLAVRAPYLNCWLQTGAPVVFGANWPTSFNLPQTLGWSVLVRVDGLTYSFLGDVPSNLHNGTVNSTSIVVTPTQTMVTAQAGPMQVNLTFLNPIEPQNWVKQSIPFSYLAFSAASMDGAGHAVQVYSDVTGEWNSGDRTEPILWSMTFNANVVFHSVSLQTQVRFTEEFDQAEWGTLYYAMQAEKNVTYQIASDTDSRSNFTYNGVLNDQQNPAIRPVNDSLAVFAISRDLGTIKATQAPVVWAIGYTTDDAVSYTDLSGTPQTSRSSYYRTQYSNDGNLIVDFLKDFGDASSRARDLDSNILQVANSVSDNLGNLVSASIAQVFGSMELTVGTGAHGTLNRSDVMMFMKNIGGVKKNRVNAVETLYAAFPALMFINSSFGAPLLEPLYRLQESSNYTIPYAAADLGSNYPTVSGSNSNHSQGVEQTANMLIMTYAYARASGDGSFINRYYNLLTTWANYLNTSTLFPSNQTSADNLSVSNQTDLAIKGIIAIAAMSKMSGVAKQADDVNKYSTAAALLYAQWKRLALASDQHILAVYGESNSWTLGYNLFADVWLGTNLVESTIYDGHSNFTHNLVLTSNFSTFGMPVDSLHTNVAVSGWSLFAAAMTTNQGLSSDLVTKVFNRANNRTIPGVFPVYYGSENGTSVQGMASPAQGAVFAPLALGAAVKTINPNKPATKKPPPSRKTRINAPIAGVIIGSVVAGLTLIGIAFLVRRQWRRRRARLRPRSILSFSTADSNPVEADPQTMVVTPFDPNSYSSEEISRDSGILTWPEQRPSMKTEGPEGEMDTLHRLSRTAAPPTVHVRSQSVAPVSPAGLSSKRARLLEALISGSPRQSQTGSSPSPNVSHHEPTSSLTNIVTESGDANSSSETQRLHSAVESLRCEMEELRAKSVIIEAPPSYTQGDR